MRCTFCAFESISISENIYIPWPCSFAHGQYQYLRKHEATVTTIATIFSLHFLLLISICSQLPLILVVALYQTPIHHILSHAVCGCCYAKRLGTRYKTVVHTVQEYPPESFFFSVPGSLYIFVLFPFYVSWILQALVNRPRRQIRHSFTWDPFDSWRTTKMPKLRLWKRQYWKQSLYQFFIKAFATSAR